MTFIKNFISLPKKAKQILPIMDYTDYMNTVFIAGTGRSGTTWIQNIINHANTFRTMFEPFYPEKTYIINHFRYKQYIRPENTDEKFIEPVMTILSGNVRNQWIDKFNKKRIVNKRIIKDIRANLLLKWIKTNFPEIPIILLTRHPCAVAHSRLKLGWKTQLEVFLSQEELMEDYLNPFRTEIESAQNIFEKHIFTWCIENYVPLKQFKLNEIHLCFYEDLCTQPNHEIQRIFSFLKTSYKPRVLDIVRKPSPLARNDSAVISGESLTESWKNYITNEQLNRTVEILSLFGLDRVYSWDSMPLTKSKNNSFVL